MGINLAIFICKKKENLSFRQKIHMNLDFNAQKTELHGHLFSISY